MKKISLLRRNAIFTSSSFSIASGVVALVLLFALLRVIAPNFFMLLTAPIFGVGQTLTVLMTSARASFADAGALMRERDQLLADNVALANKNLELEARLSDLTKLVTTPENQAGIVGGVLVRPPQAGYDVLIIGAGSAAGASAHMRVFAPGDIPIGEVESVTATTARVTLYSAPGSAHAAWVGEKRAAFTLLGVGAGAFTATISKTAEIKEGDVVYVPGPGALPIGVVSAVLADASSPSAVLEIRPLANPFSLTWVKLVP